MTLIAFIWAAWAIGMVFFVCAYVVYSICAMVSDFLQGGAASQDRSARVAHNHGVAGSNPAPATNFSGQSSARVVAQPCDGGSDTLAPASSFERNAPWAKLFV